MRSLPLGTMPYSSRKVVVDLLHTPIAPPGILLSIIARNIVEDIEYRVSYSGHKSSKPEDQIPLFNGNIFHERIARLMLQSLIMLQGSE